jgi:3'-5' exoribonuclease
VAKSKPPLVRLSEMKPGQAGDFYALLADRTRNARKDGKPFYSCKFRDGRRTAAFMAWADGPWFEACEKDWQVGTFFKIRGLYDEHPTYGPQLDIANVRLVNGDDTAAGFDPLDFVEKSRYAVDAMFQDLWNLAETNIADEPLRRLVLTILDRQRQPLKTHPATQGKFFPFAGGLLEHTLSVAHSCLHLVDKYVAHYPDLDPPLSRDLVLAGAILHDIGRTLEFADDPINPQPTVPGRLLGHLFLGRDLVRDTARELADVDAELVQRLEHILITHLGLPEWGSPRLPLIPECLIIHHADDLDAKLEMYVRCLSKDQEPGPFTARDPVLGKQLYKGQKKKSP